MVPWRDINIEAPIARAFLDRGLTTASHVITVGALAGLTSVMLVMMLGQTRVLYSMAKDGLLPTEVLCGGSPEIQDAVEEYHPGRAGGRGRGQHHADRRYRENGEYRHSACLRDCVHGHHGPAQDEPGTGQAVRTPWVPLVPILGIGFNGYMMYKLGWINWARLIVWLLIGLVVYFSYGRHHSHLAKDNELAGGR